MKESNVTHKDSKSKEVKSRGTQYKAGSDHVNWVGGMHECSGYIRVMTERGKYRPLHIILMEWYLGRRLETCECVHHCNENKKDNRLDNLELMLKTKHSELHGGKIFRDPSVRAKSRDARRFSQIKETHSCWNSNITPVLIDLALKTNTTKKEAAKTLGIHPDTLRARIKYYISKGMTF